MSQAVNHDHLVHQLGRPEKADAGHTAGTTAGESRERRAWAPIALLPRLSI